MPRVRATAVDTAAGDVPALYARIRKVAGRVPNRFAAIGALHSAPMYRTNIATTRVGLFDGPMAVSMRPFTPDDAARAAAISARYPDMHGGPIHQGDPAAIGIADLARVDYGDAVPLHDGEIPLFWACGVTSQAAVESARLPLVIAHVLGCMLITDRPHAAHAWFDAA